MKKKDPEKAAPKVLDLLSMEIPDPQFMSELSRSVGDVKPDYCYQCMKCTSGCDVIKFEPEYMPHQFVSLARLGFRDKLTNSKVIWNCTTCSYCKEVCPQGVSPVEMIKAVRRIAVKSGQFLEDHRKISKFLLESGHLVPVNEKFMGLRKELNLSPLPPTTHMYPKALMEVKEILKLTGFTKLIAGPESEKEDPR